MFWSAEGGRSPVPLAYICYMLVKGWQSSHVSPHHLSTIDLLPHLLALGPHFLHVGGPPLPIYQLPQPRLEPPMSMLNGLVEVRSPWGLKCPLGWPDAGNLLQEVRALVECSVVVAEADILLHILCHGGWKALGYCCQRVGVDVPRPVAELTLGHALCRRVGSPLALHNMGRLSYVKAAAKRGREPPQKEFYCSDRNKKAFNDTRLKDSEQAFYSCSNCQVGQRHRVYVTHETCKRYCSGGGIPCRICNPDPRRSGYEVEVEKILKDMFGDVEYFLECRALKGWNGSIDFTIFSPRVLIQVDGPAHFNKPFMYERSAKGQQGRVDDACNDVASKQGWHMLRIHFEDIKQSESLIRSVLENARSWQRRRELGVGVGAYSSVVYSPSFKRPTRLYAQCGEGSVRELSAPRIDGGGQ